MLPYVVVACALFLFQLQPGHQAGLGAGGNALPRPVPNGFADCNGNGVPDDVEVRYGLVEDCQGDGIPDECQLETPFRYQWDDGQMNGSVGTVPRHVAWLSHHVVKPGFETVTDVEMTWGLMPSGTPATVGLWLDPDGDGNPLDAQPILLHEVSAKFPQSGIVVREDVPDTWIGPAGTSFFVGVFGEFEPSPVNYPGPLDDNSTDFESWWITSDTPIVPDALGSGAIFEFGLIGQFCPCNGDWMLRALSCFGGHCEESADVNANSVPDECEDCNGNGVPDDLDIAAGTSSDCDADLVPDECVLTDCDRNGHADLCQSLAGEGLAGEYYANKTLQGGLIARVDPMIDFDFSATPPFPGSFPSSDFSVRWTGSVTTGPAGTYTFGLDHERGVRLWVNGVGLVDDWWDGNGFDTGSIDLAASSEYFIRLEYFAEGGPNHVTLSWQPPGGSMAPVPPSALRPLLDRDRDGVPDPCQFADCNDNGVEDDVDVTLGTSSDCDGDLVPDECQACDDCDGNGLLISCELAAGPGIVGQYFTTAGDPPAFDERLDVRIDPNIDFDWTGGSPAGLTVTDNFGVRWTGALVTPPVSGDYTFHVQSDDGVRLWLDGALRVDEWHPSSGNEYSFVASLAAGSEHLLQVDWYEGGGDARVHLRWTEPGGSKVPVPQGALQPDTDVDGDGVSDLCQADCNQNGIPDPLDVDLNGNCIPDDCESGAAYWRFEEQGGSAILDETGHGVHGSLNALALRVTSVPVTTVPLTGQPDTRAVDLDWQGPTSGGLATIPDLGGWLSAGDASFTLEAWVKLDEIATSGFGDPLVADDRQWLFMKKPPAGSDALLEYAFLVQAGELFGTDGPGNALAFRYGDGTAVHNVASDLSIEDFDWHFVSLAYHAPTGTLRFGLDGIFDWAQLAGPGPSLSSASSLIVGAHENQSGTKNQFVRGTIDEVRVTRAYLPPETLLDHEP